MNEEQKGVKVVIEARVREILTPLGVRMSEGIIDHLNSEVGNSIKKAVDRCIANGRKTLQVQDF